MKTFLLAFNSEAEEVLADTLLELNHKITGTCGLHVDGEIVRKFNCKRLYTGNRDLLRIRSFIENTDNSEATIIIAGETLPKNYKQLENYCTTGYWVKFNHTPAVKYRPLLIVNDETESDSIVKFIELYNVINIACVVPPSHNFMLAVSQL